MCGWDQSVIFSSQEGENLESENNATAKPPPISSLMIGVMIMKICFIKDVYISLHRTRSNCTTSELGVSHACVVVLVLSSE